MVLDVGGIRPYSSGTVKSLVRVRKFHLHPPFTWRHGRAGVLVPLLAPFLVCLAPCVAEESDRQPRQPVVQPVASEPPLVADVPESTDGKENTAAVKALAGAPGLVFHGEPFTRRGTAELLKSPAPQESAVFGQYRQALERESRRMADRNPAMFWTEMVDEDGYPLRGSDRVQRDARRLFGGASNRLMSGFLDRLLDESTGLRAARSAVEGLRVDLKRGGGVGVGAGPARDGGRDVKASVGVMLLGRPRMEVRSDLTGSLRARLEVPLDSLGMRATLSQKFGSGWRGTLTLGSEEDERWISAGFEVDF